MTDGPRADTDALRLEKPAGTIVILMTGEPMIRLRRPTVGEVRKLLERYDEIRADFYESDETAIRGQRQLKEGKSAWEAQTSIGPMWLAEVIAVLTDNVHIYDDPSKLPSWTTNIAHVFKDITNHWFEVPLASGDSANGSQPSVNVGASPSPLPPLPAPVMIGQATPGMPAPG